MTRRPHGHRCGSSSFGDLDGHVWGAAVDAGEPAIVFATPDGTGGAAGTGAVGSPTDGARLAARRRRLRSGRHPGPDRAAEAAPVRPTAARRLVPGRPGRALQSPAPRQLGRTASERPAAATARRRARAGWTRSAACRAGSPPTRRSRCWRSGPARRRVRTTIWSRRRCSSRRAGRRRRPAAVDHVRSGGRPARASLELWIGEGEEQYPRRAAAEARGDAGRASAASASSSQVTPLRCHTAGLDGAGVYLLARF